MMTQAHRRSRSKPNLPNVLLAAENNAGKNPITEWSTTDDENMYFIIV